MGVNSLNVLVCIFNKTLVAWGMSIPDLKVFFNRLEIDHINEEIPPIQLQGNKLANNFIKNRLVTDEIPFYNPIRIKINKNK